MADLGRAERGQPPVPGGTQSQEGTLQNLQCVSVGDQQDVTTVMLPLQLRGERGRPVQHSGRRLNVAVRVYRIGLVGCPDMRVVAGR